MGVCSPYLTICAEPVGVYIFLLPSVLNTVFMEVPVLSCTIASPLSTSTYVSQFGIVIFEVPALK